MRVNRLRSSTISRRWSGCSARTLASHPISRPVVSLPAPATDLGVVQHLLAREPAGHAVLVFELLIEQRGHRKAIGVELKAYAERVRDMETAAVTVALRTHDKTTREQLARTSAMALSYVAQSARSADRPAVSQTAVDECTTAAAQFMTRWRDDPDPRHIEAIDAYWVSAAEHGMNASTFTARVIASTGADVAATLSGAIGAMSGPLHGGAPARVLPMIEEVERTGDAERLVKGILDRKERLMGFGHRVYRAEDPRARVRAQQRNGCRLHGTRRPMRLNSPRLAHCASANQTGRSKPTLSSGRR